MIELGCYKCGKCCKGLYLFDKIMISLHTKSLMLNSVCKFLSEDNLCEIYPSRPKICRDWECGASKS